jgi:uncharacterized glyoxalase superfamily protein PhnB
MTTPETEYARTVSSEVTVAVDPQTAFAVFTEEIDLWWVRGPINFHDAARAIGMRCEPGVGGRLLELYSQDASDALELGRITTWQPGSLLAWDSSVDDVSVEVRFEPAHGGTAVTVHATIPAGRTDHGGTAWVRVVPGWYGAWCERRNAASHTPADQDRLALAIYYAKPAEAARWLADAFGLGAPDEFASGDYEHSWIEFHVGISSILLFPLDGVRAEDAPATHVPWVYVDDLDAHLEHARSRGATILSPIRQHGYRAYEAADLAGHRWTFVQARPAQAHPAA